MSYLDKPQFQVPGLNFGLGNIQQQVAGNSLIPQVGIDLSQFGNSYDGAFSSQFGSPSAAVSNPATTTPTFWQNALGYKNANGESFGGWAGPALSLLQSGLGFYFGSQQLGQVEDALAENRRQFDLNYGAQKKLINDQLAWQYQARKDRNAANAGELTQI